MRQEQKLDQDLDRFLSLPEGSARDRARQMVLDKFEYLVVQTSARRFSKIPNDIDRDDLNQAGLIGLLTGIETFDPERGTVFKSWAITCIRTAMVKYIKEESNSRKGVVASWSVGKAVRELTNLLGREPIDVEIAAWMEISEEALAEKNRCIDYNHPFYLSQVFNEGSDSGEDRILVLEDLLIAEEDIYETALTNEKVRIILQYVESLPNKLKNVALMMFKSYSIKEISESLGITTMDAGASMHLVRKKIRDMVERDGHGSLFEDRARVVADKKKAAEKSLERRKEKKAVRKSGNATCFAA